MRRFTLLLLALAFLSGRPTITRASSPLGSALPPQARVLAEEPVAGVPNAEVVSYVDGGPLLGVISGAGGTSRLVWKRPLPWAGALVPLSSPGFFGGLAHAATGSAGEFFAYRFEGDRVVTAVASHPHGIVKADEGVRFSGAEFVVTRSDRTHIGSVKYQTVTHFALSGNKYAPVDSIRRPDYPSGGLPSPRMTVTTTHGDTILLRLRVAATAQQQETGLMNIKQLDPDTGMIFVWSQPVLESFWMENTYIPLTVAFLSPNGTIQEMQDMQPLTTTYHTPLLPYQYAIEANLGFFAANGIQVGDRLELDLSSTG